MVVPQHQLNTFLASAEDLEILGLSKKCANIHIGADLEDYDLGPLELPPRRNKRLKRKRDKAAVAANSAEAYEEPEIKQENSFDEAAGTGRTVVGFSHPLVLCFVRLAEDSGWVPDADSMKNRAQRLLWLVSKVL